MNLPAHLSFVRDHLAAINREFANLSERMAVLERLLSQVLETAVEGAVEALPTPTAPPSEHRRLHRPGYEAKLSADPELRAFVEARLGRMTFYQIAAEVAAHFPPERQVKKSAIGEWHRKTRGRKSPTRSG